MFVLHMNGPFTPVLTVAAPAAAATAVSVWKGEKGEVRIPNGHVSLPPHKDQHTHTGMKTSQEYIHTGTKTLSPGTICQHVPPSDRHNSHAIYLRILKMGD